MNKLIQCKVPSIYSLEFITMIMFQMRLTKLALQNCYSHSDAVFVLLIAK